jgi:Rha family phage regulatory protein
MTDLFGDQTLPIAVPKLTVVREEISAEDLGLRLVSGSQNRDRIVSDSRKFAKVFGKQHRNVVRDIEIIQGKICSNLSTSSTATWFRKASYFDTYGREQDCYDLTRDGALTLGMSYDPVIAALVLLAFNKLEDALGDGASVHTQSMMNSINAHIESLLTPLYEAVEWIQNALNRRRVDITSQDQRIHCQVTNTFFNGKCPCCQLRRILDSDGQILLKENGMPVADYDHAKQSAVADLHHTWLICTGDKTSCHYKVTHGVHAVAFRLDIEHAWCNYQRRVIDYVEQANLQGKLL